MDWYYVSEGDRVGPVTDDDLATLVTSGDVHSDTLVWCDGMPDWVSYGEIAKPGQEEGTDSHKPKLVVCSECGKNTEPEASITFEGATVCAVCKPILFARFAEGSMRSTYMHYAGFWVRAGAKFVDYVLIGMFNTVVLQLLPYTLLSDSEIIRIAVSILGSLAGLVVMIAYNTWFVGRYAATPGKMLFGLRIVRSDGRSITYNRAFGRFFADFLSSMILYIGYFMAAFDEEKRALHDYICDTRVIRDA